MNLNILLLNFLKCSIAEYASKPCSECAWCKNGPVHEEEDPDSFQEDGHACGGDEGFHHGLTLNLSEKYSQ